jgi:hypothetical protein
MVRTTIISLLSACGVLLSWLIAAEPATAEPQAGGRVIVEVMAVHDHAEDRHLFRFSEREIPAGWTTVRFTNASPVDHFFLIWRYPEDGMAAAEAAGQSLLDHWHDSVAMSFEGFQAYLEGEITLESFSDGLVAALQSSAPWFLDPGAAPHGGPGFTAAGRASETTVLLEPGEYIVECYIRDEKGLFHTLAGMLDHITVRPERSSATQPEGTARVVISSEDGIAIEAPPVRGHNVVEVHFRDQAVYPHFLGHNVQLARLRDGADPAARSELAQWMDWRHPEGLVNRAPAGTRFIGGVMEMTGGSTAYLHVELEPGDYAWIAEVPDPEERNMLQTFSIR